MIIQFTVGNYLSFNEKRTLSFEAQGISELKNHVFTAEKYNLLRSAVIYGANSSGKSNLLKALNFMRHHLLNSVKLNANEALDYNPFLLSTESENQPTFFEIVFLHEKKRYRYGFEQNATQIVSEWLFVDRKEKPLFVRTLEGIAVHERFEEGVGKETATNDNRLFVSLVAQLGGAIAKNILAWFESYNVISGIQHENYELFTNSMLHRQPIERDTAVTLFRTLKLGFQDIKITESEFDPSDIPAEIPKSLRVKMIKSFTGKKSLTLETIHHKFDKNGNIVDSVVWDKEEHESEGTKKIIDLSVPIFDSLEEGQLLIIDEFDSKLHPLISRYIVGLFNSPKTNPKNAQLLFATHDTNLLSIEFMRRDQIWFTEKDEREQTDLYSAVDIELPDGTKIRADANLEKNYMRGRYGAIPFITH